MTPQERAGDRARVVSLTGTGGDAWAWEEIVEGTADCDDISVQVNGSTFPVEVNRAGDRFSATIPIAEGRNEVVAVCSLPDGGRETSDPIVFVGRLRSTPKARIEVSLGQGSVRLDGGRSAPAERGGAEIRAYQWSAGRQNPAPVLVRTGSLRENEVFDAVVRARRIAITPPEVDGEYYFSLRIADAEGREDASTTYFVVSGGKPRLVDMPTENPGWVDRAIVYGVVPPLFGNAGLRSVERRLPYLRDLGINAVWLSPINATIPGDFGYSVTDYFDIRPDYGTKEDLRSLVARAHELGIRVLMDFVPNHTSSEHPYFRDARKHGASSHYHDFYDRDEGGNPTHYFDWTHLPNLNYDNPEVRRMMLAAFSYWVREFDVDGFRVDVAWGVRQRAPSFWPRWRAELKRIKPDLLLLAEASARDPYYFSNGFDAAYDWTDRLGHWAWQGVFDAPEVIADWLDSALTNDGHGYADDALVFRFMNNNDTGPRFVTTYGADLTRVAATMLLTLPGMPLIYTGDEVGASYLPYSDRNPLTWEDDVGLREFYRTLIALRNRLPALRSREWRRVEVGPTASLYAYVRPGQSDHVLVVLNYGFRTTARIPAGAVRTVTESGTLRDLLSGRRVGSLASGSLRVAMPAYSARILVPAEGAR